MIYVGALYKLTVALWLNVTLDNITKSNQATELCQQNPKNTAFKNVFLRLKIGQFSLDIHGHGKDMLVKFQLTKKIKLEIITYSKRH